MLYASSTPLLIIGLGGLIGVLWGAWSRHTRFCTMGALADRIAFGSNERLHGWGTAVAVALMGASFLDLAGWIRPHDSLYTGATLAWGSHLAGGIAFGSGMVLASGCGAQTLIRAGAGNLRSWIVLIVMALTALTTLKGLLAVPRLWLQEWSSYTLTTHQDLPSLASYCFGITRQTGLGLAIALASTYLVYLATHKSWSALRSGSVMGMLVTSAWWVTGHWGYVAEDPETLEPAYLATNGGMEALSFVSPIAGSFEWLMRWTDSQERWQFGMMTVVGVLVGAFLHARRKGNFRWEGFSGKKETARHLIGAALMGFGAVTALGCSVGQSISGLSLLSLGSVFTTLGIVYGAVIVLKRLE